MRKQTAVFFGLVSSIVVAFIAIGLFVFGSIDRAAAFLAGRDIIIRPMNLVAIPPSTNSEKAIGRFVFANLSGRSIRIVGAETQCDCISTTPLPITIAARQDAIVEVELRKESVGNNAKARSIKFFTDSPHEPVLSAGIMTGPAGAESHSNAVTRR